MEFNPSKCQLLHIFRSRSLIKSEYYIHGQEIETVDSAKYLGVNTGADHSWSSHICKIISTANRTLGFVKRNVKTNKIKK